MKRMLTPLFWTLLALGGPACTEKDPVVTVKTTVVKDKGWTFETTPVWADEFDYNGKPNPAKWAYDVGASGWGNNEKQYYTSGDNSDVANGMLTITAKKESREGAKYTSSRMVTRNLGDFTYGRIEAKMKLPSGRGTWPAFWMLPTDYAYGNWPKSGEIDIMEHVGYDPNVVHITTHCEAYYFKLGNQKSASKKVDNATTDFHTYRVDWTPYAVRGYIDDFTTPVFEYVNQNNGYATWPFDKRFHLLLNIAVGGDWGGAQGIDDNIFPATMLVDYVRVYKMIEK